MGRLSCCLVFAVAILSASLCAEERFVNKDGGWSAEFPAGFETKKKGEEAIAISEKDDAMARIEQTRLAVGLTVAHYMNLCMEDIKKSNNEFKKLGSGTIATPANSQVPWTRYSIKGEAAEWTEATYFIFNTKNRKVCVLRCRAKSDVFESKIAEFDKFVQSFRFE